MSRTLDVYGIKPLDDKYRQMYKVWLACKDANVPVPQEVDSFFEGQDPDGVGMQVSLPKDAVLSYNTDWCMGYDIDLTKIDKNIKLIRVFMT